jgi:hypothetical protein
MRAAPIVLLGCAGGEEPYVPPEPSVEDPPDTGPGPVDDEGTDEDGDGWTVEAGDCDDSDIMVNPARDEDRGDGKDNDCDGRIDEQWSGVTVGRYDENGDNALVTLDQVGRISDELGVDCLPVWIDHAPSGIGWIANDSWLQIVEVSPSGACTALGDFSPYEDEGIYVYGMAAHPDGTVLFTTLGSLVRILPNGRHEELATWAWDWNDPTTFQAAVYTIAVDLRTGEVGLFDYFGGFATWSEAGGVVFHRIADVSKTWDGLVTYGGASRDGGGWLTVAEDTIAGGFSIVEFDIVTASWVERAGWPTDNLYAVGFLALDGDTGDYYVTANGGWYTTIWRVRDADTSVANFYVNDGSVPGLAFYGITSNY